MMPSNSLCVSCPLSFKERWAWPSSRERQEPAEACLLGFCVALSPSAPLVSAPLSFLTTVPGCPGGTHKGPGSPRLAAWLFLWALSGFLWLVVRCLREASKLWVESDARIQLGLTQLRCAPRDLRAVITATAGMSSAHFTRLLFKRFMHARSEEA